MLNDDELYKRVKWTQMIVGAVPSPFDCYLVMRSVKTLSLRMAKHGENSLAVARALERNPRIERVFHPALESHPDHELYKKQMTGFGGMVAVYIKGGLEEATTFLKSLKVMKRSIEAIVKQSFIFSFFNQ